MHLPPDTSTEGRILELERQVADLRQTGSRIYDPATDQFVSVSSLAFGQVADLWDLIGAADILGVAGATVGTQTDPANWTFYPRGPSVRVLVRGGRLRVDWAALLYLAGADAYSSAYWVMSYDVTFLGPPDAPDTVSQRVINPDYYRGIVVRDFGKVGAINEAGNWFMHTGLTPGWYRVQAAFRLSYDVIATTAQPPHGWGDNPRVAATPL